jgi:hypothetical protein
LRSRAAPDKSALAQFTGEIVEDRIARRRNVLKKLLKQAIVMIGELFQHGEPGFLLAVEIARVEIDHFGRQVFAIDKGAFQREIDKPAIRSPFQIGIWRSTSGVREDGCSVASVSRMRLLALSILLRNRKRGMPCLQVRA